MGIMISAVLMILLALAPWLPQFFPSYSFPDQFEVYRSLGIALLGLGLVAGGYLSYQQKLALKSLQSDAERLSKCASDSEAKIASKIQELEKIKERHQRIQSEGDRIMKELDELKLRNDELLTAYEDVKGQLETLKRQTKQQLTKATDQEVVNFLALLQRSGRFVDFIMDDVTKYADAQIGAAARVVHQGCAEVVREYFDIKPITQTSEGSTLTLEQNYDPKRYKLLGRVGGEPPYAGKLLHRGWLTETVRLPEQLDHLADTSAKGIIAPAEVELS